MAAAPKVGLNVCIRERSVQYVHVYICQRVERSVAGQLALNE